VDEPYLSIKKPTTQKPKLCDSQPTKETDASPKLSKERLKRKRPLRDDVYLVEKVVAKKKVGRKVMYFVKWEGYTSADNTWEPTQNLANVRHLIKEF
jgi:hypothetical protein